jgi:hypothetical protein
MGLFDTVILDPPLVCSRCSSALVLQTKHFDPLMMTYRIGSIVSDSPVVTGILEDLTFCDRCRREGRESTEPIYLVVWHHILAGVERSEADAESLLASIDRLHLIGWLDQAQQAEREWRQRFRRLYRDVRMWHEHLERDASADEGEEAHPAARGLAGFNRLPEEILNADDPLAQILADHKEGSPEEDGMF